MFRPAPQPRPTGLAAPVARAVAAAAVALSLTGCQAIARVTVSAGRNGAGTVTVALTLDRPAAARMGPLDRAIRLDDLRARGWTVHGPSTAPDGGSTIAVSHGFSDPAEATRLLQAVTGPSGPLSRLRLTQTRTPVVTTTRLAGTVDLRRGVDAFAADPAVAAVLGAPSVAGSLRTLAASGGTTPTFVLEVGAQFPGGAGHPSGTALDAGTTVWRPPLGSVTPIAGSAQSWDLRRLVFGIVSAAALLAAGVLAVVMAVRRRNAANASATG